MITYYCSLADAKLELNATGTVDDAKLFRNIRNVSTRLNRLSQARRPLFLPYVETREFRLEEDVVDTFYNTFYLGQALLSVTSVDVSGTTLTVGTNVEVWPTLDSPSYRLRLIDNDTSWYSYCGDSTKPPLVKVTGTWGYHSDYSNAWLAVDTLAAGITASAKSLTVADVDGTDDYGISPRISAGNLLKIGTEYLWVVATNTTTNAVTVVRGVLGSTAAAHLITDSVSVYQVEDDIRRVIARQAAFLYARIGAFENAVVSDIGTVSFPSDLLAELRATLGGYAYV